MSKVILDGKDGLEMVDDKKSENIKKKSHSTDKDKRALEEIRRKEKEKNSKASLEKKEHSAESDRKKLEELRKEEKMKNSPNKAEKVNEVSEKVKKPEIKNGLKKEDKKEKQEEKPKKKKIGKLKIFGIFCLTMIAIGLVTVNVLLYGPNYKFRDWLVTNAMTTLHHKYLATWFYSDEEIDEVMSRNRVVEVDQNTNTDLIRVGDIPPASQTDVVYANEYEREILEREEEQDYKLIELHEDNYDGYLAVIYDPSRISVATSKGLGSSGQYLVDMAKANDATVAINGGGFADERR